MTDNPKRVIIWCRVSSLEQGATNKESLPDQLSRQRALALKMGWSIIDEIVTDFSMDYFTYDEFSQAAAAAGWRDQARMWSHWSEKDFDIITCRYLDRVGREQSILSEFIGRTMRAGAEIKPLDESSVDKVNHRMVSAIAGLSASEYLDKLKKNRDLGMKGHAGRGEKIGNRVPMFYVADADGKLKPNRADFQRLFDDIAELFLAGTSYEQFPQALADRGHSHPKTGKLYDKVVIKRLMYSARTWGHGEYNRTGKKRGAFTLLAEPWCTGRGEPPPDVYFRRDVCEPLWEGSQREAMIDELERRFYAIRGGARPNDTYSFSQLCVCEVCQKNMAVQITHKPLGDYCYMKCTYGRQHRGCNNNQAVRFDKIQDFLTNYIEWLLTHPNEHFADEPPAKRSRSTAIEKDIAKASQRISNWQDSLGETHPGSRAELLDKINAETKRRETLYEERERLTRAAREEAHTAQSRQQGLTDIRTYGVAWFWNQPTTTVNQTLRKLLGSRRVLCNGGEVAGWTTVG